MNVIYGFQKSPFGWCLIALVARDICKLSFMDTKNERKAARSIREIWPEAHITRDDARVKPYVGRIFGRSKSPLSLVYEGTPFQMKVWKTLMKIPSGKTVSYADVARSIGAPKAMRAVGSACGKNPIGYLIPCHRVVASDGGLGGFGWGLKRKAAMLAWESAKE